MRVEVVHSGGAYANRVIAHLESKAAGEVTAFQLPAALPLMVDDPEEFLPAGLGAAEVIVAIHLHQDLLLEIPHFVKGKATRALIAPIEDPTWIRPGLQRQVSGACAAAGIESAFPRPFCHLEPATPVIEEFSRAYEVGRPEFKFTVNGGKIVKAEMVRGALCGACEKVAEGLVGMSLSEDVVQAAGVLHHTFPCMASMAMVEELGDTLMHESIRMVKGGVKKALEEAEEGE
jgi:hypothetical protein